MCRVLTAIAALVLGCPATSITESPSGVSGETRPALCVVATSHLDTQWRWTVKETITKYIPATFRDNFALMERFPDYTFSFEGAYRYMLLKEYYPEDFERLKPYIAAGRWRVAGSWVDASDVNVPSFESLVRHTLYGNGFFEREFGRTSRDILLPDCFGFGYTLPSIAAHCGLKSFSTQKLSWGSSVGVPFDIGLWEGVDGSSVIAALKPGSYGTEIESDLSRDSTWMETVERQGKTSGLYAAYMYFGTGDTGGAPDSTSVYWLEKSTAGDGPIRVASVGSDDIVDVVASVQDVHLPRYKGELLMTRHGVGCYTSQAAMKRFNRKNELLADAAERASVIAHSLGGPRYPREALRQTWVQFLWHQFHDDLTGTSIPEAYQYSWNDEILCLNKFAGILTGAVESATAALDTRGRGVPLVVYNPLAVARRDVVEATVVYVDGAPDMVRVYGPDGAEVPSQVSATYEDSLHLLFLADVPPVGYAVYDVRPSQSPCQVMTEVKAGLTGLENERYAVEINGNGDVASIYDKVERRGLLSRPVTLELLYNKPRQWPAWEIQHEDIMAQPQVLADENTQIRVLEEGPVRAAVQVTRRRGQSVFRTTIRLAASTAGDRVEFDNDIEWYERETLLKVAVTPATPSELVTYDLGLGTVQRGVNRPELYEVPGHQWADMTPPEGAYGVAVLNDCKYGWDHPDEGTLRLTLIHTPGIDENWSWVEDQRSQDLGRHRMLYALQGHRGDWRDGGVAWQAARLNQPLLAFQTGRHDGSLGKSFSLVQVETGGQNHPPVMVNAVKIAEDSDEVVIRLRELTGAPVDTVRVRFAFPLTAAREIDGTEKPIGQAEFDNETLITSLTPYRPRAFAVRFADQRPVAQAPVCEPVSLPYNLDGVSSDEDRGDGDFDGSGHTLPAELLPDTLVHNGVPLVLGTRTPQSRNVLSCDGQTLNLPAGKYNRLCLVAAAVDGPAGGTFTLDDYDTTLWIQDYAQPLGQWNSRLIAGEFVEEAGRIAPAYILRQPVIWAGTHRHGPDGYNEVYQFVYLYLFQLDVPENARTLTLPRNPRIRLLAATMANTGGDPVRPARPLYDVAHATLARVSAERHSFTDSMVVRLHSPVPAATVYYTVDGSEPSLSSQQYAVPVVVKETTQLNARAFLPGADDSYVTRTTFTRLVPRPAADLGSPMPGLHCSYYEGEWTELPDFDALTVEREDTMDSVAIPEFAQEEDYGLVFTGYVRVPRDGLYDFFVNSDDGSALFVDGSLIADNDGIHGEWEISGEVALKAGLHPIAVRMFQRKGGQLLEVSWQGPGLERRPLSADMLFHEGEAKRR